MSFRLLTYNIRHGGRGREPALAEVIGSCRPDLVVFQEATNEKTIDRIASLCGMTQCGAQPKTSLGFMSRHPVTAHTWHRPRLSRHAFLEIHPSGVDFPVFGVHLSAVHAAWTERRRMIELGALLRTIKQHDRGFHLLAGDFNMSDRSSSYRALNDSFRDAMRASSFAHTTYDDGLWSLLQFRIDYVFVSSSWCAGSGKTFTVPGSDHDGLEVDLGACPS